MEKESIINLLKDFFKKCADQYGIECSFLYGSWGRGEPREDSDVDIAILFSDSDSSDNETFDSITDISLRLTEKLCLEASVLVLDRDFKHPMLYYNAIVHGIPVFVRHSDTYHSLILEAIYQMEDFSLFGTDWQLKIARKNMEALTHARL
jgi:predicted nucleotidyltransferase